MQEHIKSDRVKENLLQMKHTIEIEAIKEGVRCVLKQRFLTEWQDVAREKLIKSQPVREFRPGMRIEPVRDPI